MSMQKITKKVGSNALTGSNRVLRARAKALTALTPYRVRALEQSKAGKRVKNYTMQKITQTRLTDHEVELMRVMHEEFPLGHPAHVGYRKLTAIFGCSYTTTANICRYRKRVAGL